MHLQTVECAEGPAHRGLRSCFFFQAEDGIRDLVRSRGLGDVYKRQAYVSFETGRPAIFRQDLATGAREQLTNFRGLNSACLLYTSDAADERSSVDLGGRRIIKKKSRAYYLLSSVDK